MIENGEPMKSELSAAGEERKVRMLLELRGAMNRRVARRRALRRGGSAAAFVLAVGAVWAAVVMQRGAAGPNSGETVAARDPEVAVAVTVADAAPVLRNVQVVAESDRWGRDVVVRGTDAARVAKYVAPETAAGSVEVLSDAELMRALAQTGNEYGLVRVGDRVEVECYSCDPEKGKTGSPDRR